MVFGSEDVGRVVYPIVLSDCPYGVVSSPCFGHGNNVLFIEVAVADREQLHELTSEVLLLGALHIGFVVKVDEHR